MKKGEIMEHSKGKLEIGSICDWELWIGANHHIADVHGNLPTRHANAERLVHCWNSHDDLLDALEKAEWVGMNDTAKFRCPVCMESKENGHRYDCKTKQAIAKANKS